MTTPKRVLLKAYIKPELKAVLEDSACRSGLSVSRVVERVLEHGKHPDVSHQKLVLDLLQVNADQARLGNLFHKAINEAKDGPTIVQLRELLNDIRAVQAKLKARVEGIKA